MRRWRAKQRVASHSYSIALGDFGGSAEGSAMGNTRALNATLAVKAI